MDFWFILRIFCYGHTKKGVRFGIKYFWSSSHCICHCFSFPAWLSLNGRRHTLLPSSSRYVLFIMMINHLRTFVLKLAEYKNDKNGTEISWLKPQTPEIVFTRETSELRHLKSLKDQQQYRHRYKGNSGNHSAIHLRSRQSDWRARQNKAFQIPHPLILYFSVFWKAFN